MTYTASTWNTIAVASIKTEHVATYNKPGVGHGAFDASLALTQVDDSGNRRVVLGVVYPPTCEVIPAPEVPGFVGLVSKALHRAGLRVTVADS